MLSLSNRHLRSSNNKTTQLLTTNHTQYLPEAMRAVKLRKSSTPAPVLEEVHPVDYNKDLAEMHLKHQIRTCIRTS